MFHQYYGLKEQPFGVTPDPSYLYASTAHREALASLIYSVEAGLGFASLIAAPGLGKTTLLYYLLQHFESRARTAFIFETQCNSRGLLRHILSDLGTEVGDTDMNAMFRTFRDLVAAEAHAGRRTLLVIDEAQNFGHSALETVRLLSNFETFSAKLLHIVLAGQPQLARLLAEPELAQLRQRITVAARLRPFSPGETVEYIDHRLRTAGYRGSRLFTSAALALIAQYSDGIPREINRVCFNALSLGFALEKPTIDADLVQEAVTDLDLGAMLVASAQDQFAAAPRVTQPCAARNEPASLPFTPAVPPFARRSSPVPTTRNLVVQGSPTLSAAPDEQSPVLSLVTPPRPQSLPQPNGAAARQVQTPYATVPPGKAAQFPLRLAYVTAAIAAVLLLAVGIGLTYGRRLSPLSQGGEPTSNTFRTAPAGRSVTTATVPPPITTTPTGAQAAAALTPASARRFRPSLQPSRRPNYAQQPMRVAPLSRSSAAPIESGNPPPPPLRGDAPNPTALALPEITSAPHSTEEGATSTGGTSPARLLSRVEPSYPPEAMEARIQGSVTLLIHIGKDGRVTDVRAVQGATVLTRAAISAVRRWVYVPYMLNGHAVESDTTVVVNFVL